MNTEYVSGVQYSCESRPPLTLPGTLSCTGGTRTGSRQSDGVYSPIFAYFRVVLRYFRVNSVEKSYRKAIINYLRKNNVK